MRTETIEHDGITITVRSRNRRMPIIVAQYMQAIRAAYPDLVAFEAELFHLDRPMLDEPVKPPATAYAETQAQYETQLAAYTAAMSAYGQQVFAVRLRHQLGAAVDDRAVPFVGMLSRFTLVKGLGVKLGPDGRFDNPSVIKAFEQFLDGDDKETDDLWLKISAAILRVDAPLTPVIERPPETLTEAEAGDPLSAPAA